MIAALPLLPADLSPDNPLPLPDGFFEKILQPLSRILGFGLDGRKKGVCLELSAQLSMKNPRIIEVLLKNGKVPIGKCLQLGI